MGQYISGDYEAVCKIEGKCKISTVYIQNEVTKSISVTYSCCNDNCLNHKCAANDGTDVAYFSLGKIIKVL